MSSVQTHCGDQVPRRDFMWFLTVCRRDITGTVSNYCVAASTNANSDSLATVHCLSRQADRLIFAKGMI